MARKVNLPRTEYEQELLDIGGEQWGAYENTFIPIEDAWLDTIRKGGAGEQEAMDIAAAEATHALSPIEQGAYQDAFAGGVDPNSGAFIGLATDLATRKASGVSGAVTGAKNENTLGYYDKALTASQYGRGVGSEAITGLGTSAVRSVQADRMEREQEEFNKQASAATRQALYGAAGTAAGIAAGYGLNKYGGTIKDFGSSVGEVLVQQARGRNTLTSW